MRQKKKLWTKNGVSFKSYRSHSRVISTLLIGFHRNFISNEKLLRWNETICNINRTELIIDYSHSVPCTPCKTVPLACGGRWTIITQSKNGMYRMQHICMNMFKFTNNSWSTYQSKLVYSFCQFDCIARTFSTAAFIFWSIAMPVTLLLAKKWIRQVNFV